MYLNQVKISNYAFEGRNILQNVNIEFDRSFVPSIFPLGGKQGCGKSTLLKMIFGKLTYGDSLNPKTSKAIELDVTDPNIGNVYLLTTHADEGLTSISNSPYFLTFDQVSDRYQAELNDSRAMHRFRSLLRFISTLEDSVVLMDNPDQGLHPDWQYFLCNRIANLRTSNQFIVATHSYEFCEALTPSHVKILKS